MSGMDTQVWELEVSKSSLQIAAVHAGDFTEGEDHLVSGYICGDKEPTTPPNSRDTALKTHRPKECERRWGPGFCVSV